MSDNPTPVIGTARRRRLVRHLVGIAMGILLLASMGRAAFAHAMPVQGTWATFTDPVYGFSLRYPTSWTPVHGYAGGPTTFTYGTTGTTINTMVEQETGSVASVLNAVASVGGASAGRLTVDGTPAVDVNQKDPTGMAPFTPLGPSEMRTVTLAVANSANTTTTYALQITLRTDARGQLDATAQAEMATFESMVQSFKLPPAGVHRTPLAASPNNCPPWCWADYNWNYTDYLDNANGHYCTGYNNGYTGCTTAQTAPQWDYQPDFQCAEFVARALTQGYGVPGLINGGKYGFSGTPSGTQESGWDFGKYSMTTLAYNSQHNATNQYYLVNVGNAPGQTSNPNGLYNYLIDTGMGVDEGTHVSGSGWIAGQGDVVFYFEGTSQFQHVAIVTDRYQSGSYIELIGDAHNVAEYRQDIADSNHLSGFHLVHINMDQQDGLTARPSLWNSGTGPSWSSTQNDGWGVPYNYVRMNGFTTESAKATLSWSGNTFLSCGVAVYVPNSNNASATADFWVDFANGTEYAYTVNENNNLYGAVLLIAPNTSPANSSPPTSIFVTNYGDNTGDYLGVGQFYYFC